MPLALVLGDVEISGFKLDEKVLDDIGAEFLKRIRIRAKDLSVKW